MSQGLCFVMISSTTVHELHQIGVFNLAILSESNRESMYWFIICICQYFIKGLKGIHSLPFFLELQII